MNDNARKYRFDDIMGGLLSLGLIFFVVAIVLMGIDATATTALLVKSFMVLGIISGGIAGYILIMTNKELFR